VPSKRLDPASIYSLVQKVEQETLRQLPSMNRSKIMKRAFAWFLGMMICAAVARGGEVKITVVTSAGEKGKPTTVFAPDTPEIWATFKTKETKKGEKILALEQDDGGGYFTFSKPTNGWPPGKYHLDVYAGDKLAATAKFTVEGARKTAEKPSKEPASGDTKPTQKSPKKDAAADADDAQYTFKVKNENVQRITKLLASEGGKKYLDFDIGKGIDVGETITLHWDKSTNKSGCEWYLKAVYADKSVGEAVKFDFCEEDLVISF
jgi:hypothetical protein